MLLQTLFISLNSFHVNPKSLDNAYSKAVFDLYFKWLDPQKRFFYAKDIEILSVYEESIDDALQRGEFTFFDQSTQLWRLRLEALQPKVLALLDNDFEFFVDEFVLTQHEDNLQYFQTEPELLDFWRKQLKYRFLSLYLDRLDDRKKVLDQSQAAEEIVLASQNLLQQFEPPFEMIDQNLVLELKEELRKDVKQLFKNLLDEDDESYKMLFFNALLAVFDSHSSYFPPEKKEDFDISISGQLEGIGAVLSEKDGYIVVDRILKGGAAERDGQLKSKDKILKVAQGLDGDYESIIGMRVRDAVRLIRGEKGSLIRLWVLQSSGKTLEIVLKRDLVMIEETFAKAAVIEDLNTGFKTGYITLPKFYRNFKDEGGRNSTDDIASLLIQLQEQDVQSVILDLRGNEGGALLDAVQVTGLFLDQGPIVQVKDRSNDALIHSDDVPGSVYDGPLLVMLNHYSASAAEIAAAALQDYGRAVVVGSRSYGKGTVQTFLDLKRLYPGPARINPELGSLKLTIQKFYRVSGGSTQLEGVRPDITLQDRFFYKEIGERYLDFPLAWDQISAVDHANYGIQSYLPVLKAKSLLRQQHDDRFIFMKDYLKMSEQRKNQKERSLNIRQMQQRREDLSKWEDRFDQLFVEHENLSVEFLNEDSDMLRTSLMSDYHLHESLFILYDLIYEKEGS